MAKKFILIIIELFSSLLVMSQYDYSFERELIGLHKYDSIYQSINLNKIDVKFVDDYLNFADLSNNPDTMLIYSFKAHYLLHNFYPNKNICRCFLSMAKAFSKLKYYYASIDAFQIVINQAIYLNDNVSLEEAYLGLGNIYMILGIKSDMFNCYDHVIFFRELNHDYETVIDLNNKLACFSFFNLCYKDSYFYNLKNVLNANQLNDSLLKAYVFSNIVTNYVYQYSNYDSSIINIKYNDAKKIALLSNKIINQNNYNDSLANIILYKNNINLCKIFLSMAEINNDNNLLDSCLYYLHQNNKIVINDNELSLILPRIFYAKKQYLKSYKYLQNIDTSLYINDLGYMSKYYFFKSKLQNKLGKIQESTNNIYKYDSLQVEIINNKLYQKENEIKFLVDLPNKLSLLKQFSFLRITNNDFEFYIIKVANYICIIILVLLLVAFFIGSRCLMKRKKKYNLLNNKNIDLVNQQTEIMLLRENICFQKAEEEKLSKQIHDSIVYAERIQTAVISNESDLKTLFPESFVYYKPKEIVSGDFFLVENFGDFSFLILVDCLGHGVPGGFMVMLGISYLKDILVKSNLKTRPSQIIERLGSFFINTIYKEADEYFLKKRDGMGMTVCKFYKNSYDVDFSTSYHDIYISRRGQVIVEKGNVRSVEAIIKSENDSFITKQMTLFPNDMVYFATNGLQNQKGGEAGNRFSQPGLVEFFSQNDSLPVSIQKTNLEKELKYWMSSFDQNDDITLLGVRIL